MDDVSYYLFYIFAIFTRERYFHLNFPPFFDILQYIVIMFLETAFILFPRESFVFIERFDNYYMFIFINYVYY